VHASVDADQKRRLARIKTRLDAKNNAGPEIRTPPATNPFGSWESDIQVIESVWFPGGPVDGPQSVHDRWKWPICALFLRYF